MSVHHWGEHPGGDWEVIVHFSSESGYVTMTDLAVVLYGTVEVAESVLRIPEQCDPECVRGCAAQGGKYCDSCNNQRIQSDLSCVQYCPGEDYFTDHGNTTENPCSVGGYCFNCKQRHFGLSIPLLALIAVSGLVLLASVVVMSFILWTKVCKSNDYIPI